LYALMALMGPFTLIYVPGRIFAPGDAAATVSNILAHQGLFQASIVVGVIAEVFFILVVLLLHRLFKDVDRLLAALMAVLILVVVPLALLGSAIEVATLAFARGGAFLDVFEKPQRDALVMLLMNVDRQGSLIAQVFWGLWLLPLGTLAFKSGFIPRFLGVWLVLNGLAYLGLSGVGLLAPEHRILAFNIAMPLMFGELALALWLLVVAAPDQTPAGDAQSATKSARA
jgi:hypothetical protein